MIIVQAEEVKGRLKFLLTVLKVVYKAIQVTDLTISLHLPPPEINQFRMKISVSTYI